MLPKRREQVEIGRGGDDARGLKAPDLLQKLVRRPFVRHK